MLAGARLRNHPWLAHVLGQQSLANAIVDFVCTRMIQVFALEHDTRTARLLGQALGKVQR